MTTLPTYDADQLAGLLEVLPDVDGVELKLTIPAADRSQVLDSLGVDPIEARVRQVAFIDTADLRLIDSGLVVRARRTQHKAGDLTVKLRPMLPADVPGGLREMAGFKVEVDASPTGFTCSCSLTAEVADRRIQDLLHGRAVVTDLLTGRQRSLVADRLPEGVAETDLRVLGPLTLLKASFAPAGFGRTMVAELWFLPDGTRTLELSTKCSPAEAFQAAAETKVFLAGHGVDLGAPQETKTRTALTALAATLDR